MILNTAPANEAIVSNVGEIGEFRIRNSAKAFSILSSGLYANKIRAIIRELSCNAVDSHTAAGKADTPFDVHLPNQLEAWFSIRDYGTGLTHDQVTNIYTTYFESTKTDSNAFIGALGLGSKSPFSYTDNFTVTAVKGGRKGIYTAFINEAGVPSIALMLSEDTDEPNGVEIKFAVTERYDFGKFRDEARHVYKYFGLRPVVSGNADFKFVDPEYESKDIIPGVHSYKNASNSYAIMGNIAYPVEVPNADASLGDLRRLLGCGLEMHFDIGELDFQASREGLSYIPSTVEAIKRKLTALNSALTDKLAEEADLIENLWDRAIMLSRRKESGLWSAAVLEYVSKKPIATFNINKYSGLAVFPLKVDNLAALYNIQLRCFSKPRGAGKPCKTVNPRVEYGDRHADGIYNTFQQWTVDVDSSTHFVINDTKIGAAERAKYHYRKTASDAYYLTVYVLDKADKTRDMDVAGFFAAIHNPPEARRFLASSLMEKPRASGLGSNVTIMKLEQRGGYRRNSNEMVWRDAGKLEGFGKKDIHYYVPLSGFSMQSTKGYSDAKHFYGDVTSLPGLFTGPVYGVRKSDIDNIKKLKNWVNLEEHITRKLNGKDVSSLLISVVKREVAANNFFELPSGVPMLIENDLSPYVKMHREFKNVDKYRGDSYNLTSLFNHFAPDSKLSPNTLITKYNKQFEELFNRYPMLKHLSTYRVGAEEIAEYVNLIDAKKGI
jgi:hypothetical protein